MKKDEIKRLQDVEAIVKEMFKTADKEGLYVGLGYDPRLSRKENEGPNIRKLRKLVGM